MFSLGTYLGMELLAHTVTLCLPFQGTARLFSNTWLHHCTFSLAMYKGLISPHPRQYIVFFIIAIIMGVKYI